DPVAPARQDDGRGRIDRRAVPWDRAASGRSAGRRQHSAHRLPGDRAGSDGYDGGVPIALLENPGGEHPGCRRWHEPGRTVARAGTAAPAGRVPPAPTRGTASSPPYGATHLTHLTSHPPRGTYARRGIGR